MDLRKKTEMIVVHCAATKPSMDIGASEIKKWHVVTTTNNDQILIKNLIKLI